MPERRVPLSNLYPDPPNTKLRRALFDPGRVRRVSTTTRPGQADCPLCGRDFDMWSQSEQTWTAGEMWLSALAAFISGSGVTLLGMWLMHVLDAL